MITRLIYLLLFVSPQVLLYVYLRERLPDPARPERARRVRIGLAATFAIFNLPWVLVAGRALSGSMWGVGRIPYLGPWIAWQLLGWIFGTLVTCYLLGKLVLWGSRELGAVLFGTRRASTTHRPELLAAPSSLMSRRRFLARATYSYAAAGAALSIYGIWSAYRVPQLTRRTLTFPNLPPGLDGLTLLHLSDLHAGIHLGAERMQEIVRQVNALTPDLIVQTGDMIDISRAFIPPYVQAFRELRAPLGVVTVLGNHDRYTGERDVIRGCRDAGQTFLQNDCHVIERGGATLALLGIDDPHNWTADDPQPDDVVAALRSAPAAAFKILLAHRPGAWDGAAPRGIPLTLAGHIHGWSQAHPASLPGRRDSVPGRLERELYAGVRLGPLPAGHAIDRERHYTEPHRRPHLDRSRLHRAIRLSLRHQALEAEAKVAGDFATLVVEQVRVVLHEEQLRDGWLPRRAGDQPPAQLRQLLARTHLEPVRFLHHARGPASRRPVQLVQQVLFRVEVPIDGAFGDPGLPGNQRRRGEMVARGGEQLERGADEALAGEIGLSHRARI